MSDDWASLQHNGGQLYVKGKPPHFLYIFTSLAALGGFLFGYDTGIISGAIILIRQVSVTLCLPNMSAPY